MAEPEQDETLEANYIVPTTSSDSGINTSAVPGGPIPPDPVAALKELVTPSSPGCEPSTQEPIALGPDRPHESPITLPNSHALTSSDSGLDSVTSPALSASDPSLLVAQIEPHDLALSDPAIRSNSSQSSSPLISESAPIDPPPPSTSLKSDQSPALPAPPPTSLISNPKKFKASSLSVNKKFLSQSGTGDGKTPKTHFPGSPRLPGLTASASSSPLVSGPRLLTGKIASSSSILNSTVAGVAGWAKTPVVVPSNPLGGNSPDSNSASAPLPTSAQTTNSPSHHRDDAHTNPAPKTGPNGFISCSTPQFGPPNHIPHKAAPPGGPAASPWGKFDQTGKNGRDRLVTDFPTAQEVAQHTKMRAQSIAAANAARDKALQDRAAAAAAYNQQLLQTLDGFRGTHLDPNASHWDEMEDEDDMFGEVVEFGDGTQYKVAEVSVAVPDQSISTPSQHNHPPPCAPAAHKEEPFAEDYDRSTQSCEGAEAAPPFLRGRAELKSLFNERLGKFEPYGSKSGDSTKDLSPQVQVLRRPSDGSAEPGPSVTRPRDPSAPVDAMRPKPTSTWPSSIQCRVPSGDPPAGRLLPPSQPLRDLTPCRTSLSQPLAPLQLTPASAPRPASADSFPPPPVERVDDEPAGPPQAAPAATPHKPDLDQLHRTEMSIAAERARLRRQQEEEARDKERERARQKAMEIEAKLRVQAHPPQPSHTPANLLADPVKPPSTSTAHARPLTVEVPEPRQGNSPAGRPMPSDTVESWRARPLEKSVAMPQAPPLVASGRFTAKTEVLVRPILARPVAPPVQTSPLAVPSQSSGPSPVSKTKDAAAPRSSGPLPPQDEVYRRRDESRTSLALWKPRSSAVPIPGDRTSRVCNDKSSCSTSGNADKQLSQANTSEVDWRQPEIESKAPSRSDSRQLPPHMRPRSEPPIKATQVVPSVTLPRVSDSERPVCKSGSSIPLNFAVPPRTALQDKKPLFKLPEMSHLDTVMSRIKGVLEADKEARAKAAAAAAATPVGEKVEQSASASSSSTVGSTWASKSIASSNSPITPELDIRRKLSLPLPHDGSRKEEATNLVSIDGKSHMLVPRPAAETPPSKVDPVGTLGEPPVTAHASLTGSKPQTAKLNALLSSGGLTPALSKPADKKTPLVRKAARFDIPGPEPCTPPPDARANAPSSRSVLKPTFTDRDPLATFDVTRPERSASPPPAWKAFAVKLGPSKPKPKLTSHIAKAFWNPLVPARVSVLSWEPPLANLSPRTLSRDDLLFRKKHIRGIVISHVQFPKRRINRVVTEVSNNTESPSSYRQVSDDPYSRSDLRREGGPLFLRGRGRGNTGPSASPSLRGRSRADENASWRRCVDPSVTSLSADAQPADKVMTEAVTEDSPHKGGDASSGARRFKSKIPEGVKVAFNRPAHVTTTDPSASSGMFMVTSEITGEASQTTLASTSSSPPSTPAPTNSIPLTPQNRDSGPPATLTPPSNAAAVAANKNPPSPWTKSPLAFSVLDSHTKSVWSQPDGRITTATSPSGRIENSLKGIADDFPEKLPRTLNDFNAEEDPSSDPRKDDSTRSSQRPDGGQAYDAARTPSKESGAPVGDNMEQKTLPSSLNVDGQISSNAVNRLNQTSPSMPPNGSQYQHAGTPMTSGPSYSGHYSPSSTSGFQVPPGYQLVPIGSVPPPNPPHNTPQYPAHTGSYPAQAPTPWPPSLPTSQPNEYAPSSQLYSLSSPYPSPAPHQPLPPPQASTQPLAIGYNPSHPMLHSTGIANPRIQSGNGFSQPPGPIAPRGSRASSSSVHSPHLNRPANDSGFVPTVGRNPGYHQSVAKSHISPVASGHAGFTAGPSTVESSPNHSVAGVNDGGYGPGFPGYPPPGTVAANNPFHPMVGLGAGRQITGGMVAVMSPQQPLHVAHPSSSNGYAPGSQANNPYRLSSPQIMNPTVPPPPYINQPFQASPAGLATYPSNGMSGSGSNGSTGMVTGYHSGGRSGSHHGPHPSGPNCGGYYGNNVGGSVQHRKSHAYGGSVGGANHRGHGNSPHRG